MTLVFELFSLRKLLDEQQADLFHTLETYLDEGGNGVQTAETLHIHRSTLNYRLARITASGMLDPAFDPDATLKPDADEFLEPVRLRSLIRSGWASRPLD